jgi:TetR/AcrR family transcriptional repressor of nem operon
MPRPRAFDDAAVLDAATDHFWRYGYAATSVRDLGDAMGLVPASLYNAFGSKHALFARCLDRYLDANMRARIARLEATHPPLAAIAAFLNEIVTRSLADARGCLLVNSALEVAPHDVRIGSVIAARLGELEAFFRRCVLAGQRDGSIAALPPANDLARLLLTTVMGLRVLARGKPEPALLRGAARQVLALLDPASVAPSATTGRTGHTRPNTGKPHQ